MVQDYSNHSSILKIRESFINSQTAEQFLFYYSVTTLEDYKLLKNIGFKMATGTDKIPPKLVKIPAELLSQWLADAINNGISKGIFPDNAKMHLFPLLTNNPIIKIKSQILNQLLF